LPLPLAANKQVALLHWHGGVCARSHASTSRWPLSAAALQVSWVCAPQGRRGASCCAAAPHECATGGLMVEEWRWFNTTPSKHQSLRSMHMSRLGGVAHGLFLLDGMATRAELIDPAATVDMALEVNPPTCRSWSEWSYSRRRAGLHCHQDHQASRRHGQPTPEQWASRWRGRAGTHTTRGSSPPSLEPPAPPGGTRQADRGTRWSPWHTHR